MVLEIKLLMRHHLKPSKSQGAGLNLQCFVEEATRTKCFQFSLRLLSVYSKLQQIDTMTGKKDESELQELKLDDGQKGG